MAAAKLVRLNKFSLLLFLISTPLRRTKVKITKDLHCAIQSSIAPHTRTFLSRPSLITLTAAARFAPALKQKLPQCEPAAWPFRLPLRQA